MQDGAGMIEEGECSANTVEHESMEDDAGKKESE